MLCQKGLAQGDEGDPGPENLMGLHMQEVVDAHQEPVQGHDDGVRGHYQSQGALQKLVDALYAQNPRLKVKPEYQHPYLR